MGFNDSEVNFFESTRNALGDIRNHLDAHGSGLRAGMQALAPIVPQTRHLLDNLIYLMNNLKMKLENTHPHEIPNLDEVCRFTSGLRAFLDSTQGFIDDEPALRDMRGTAYLVNSLPQVNDYKGDMINLLNDILGRLHEMKG